MTSAGGAVFIGIDAGTTGVTVAAFDDTGQDVGTAYREYPCHYPHPGWVEQDIDEVWRAICDACRAAATEIARPADRFRSIGLSSQRGTFVLLDEGERPLGRAIVWNDSRAEHSSDRLAAKLDATAFRHLSGMPLTSAWSVAKIMWVAEHRPDLFQRARWIVNGQEYFLRRMGAAMLETDPASLTLSGMLDIRALDWSDEILSAAGIPREILPPVGPPGAHVGHLSPAAAQAMGLPAGTAICRGGGDQQCAAIGAGVVRQGMAQITVGTSAMLVAHLDSVDRVRGPAPYIGGHAVAGCWDLEGGAFAIGSCLKWWRDQLGRGQHGASGGTTHNAYDVLVAEAITAPPGSGGVVFHPFFAGQVTPNYNPTARGAFLGLGAHSSRSDLLRAVLEGCACEMRLMLEAVHRDLAGGIDDLRVTGGGTRNLAFVQIQADVMRRPITLLRHRECTVLGAAILGAVAVGAFAGLGEAIDAMVAVERVIEPADDLGPVYNDLFAVFTQAYRGMVDGGVYEKLYAFQGRYF